MQLTGQPAEGSGPPSLIPPTSSAVLLPHPLDPRSPEKDQEEESRPPVMMIPYVAGMNEDMFAGSLTSACRQVRRQGNYC